MFACMDASLKNVCTASLGITYTACHLQGRIQNYSITLRFQTRTVSNPSPLNIPILPNWLTV